MPSRLTLVTVARPGNSAIPHRFGIRWLPVDFLSRRMASAAVMAVSLVFVSLAGGCQRGPTRPKTVPVDVTVSYKGKFVSGATVVFVPKDGPRGAVGRTDAQGRAKLMTFVAGDGAMPGSYRVTIDKLLDEAGPVGKTQEEYEAFWKTQMNGPAGLPPLKCELPWKYGQIEKTELTAEVKQEGKNSLRFDLVD
jgi:hypothetical protein